MDITPIDVLKVLHALRNALSETLQSNYDDMDDEHLTLISQSLRGDKLVQAITTNIALLSPTVKGYATKLQAMYPVDGSGEQPFESSTIVKHQFGVMHYLLYQTSDVSRMMLYICEHVGDPEFAMLDSDEMHSAIENKLSDLSGALLYSISAIDVLCTLIMHDHEDDVIAFIDDASGHKQSYESLSFDANDIPLN